MNNLNIDFDLLTISGAIVLFLLLLAFFLTIILEKGDKSK